MSQHERVLSIVAMGYVRLKDIAEIAGIRESYAHKILHDLIEWGFIEQVGRGTYVLKGAREPVRAEYRAVKEALAEARRMRKEVFEKMKKGV